MVRKGSSVQIRQRALQKFPSRRISVRPLDRIPRRRARTLVESLEVSPRLSKSKVRKSGERLRYALREHGLQAIIADGSLADAWATVRDFQREHVNPTYVVSSALISLAFPFDGTLPVTRIKRAERIIEKIARSSTALDRLQDIGGCRLVVSDLRRQSDVVERILARDLEVVEVDDYVALEGESVFDARGGSGPKGSGYRAVHIVHRVEDRLIETQIRTEVQHSWAVAAERAEQSTGHPLKFGEAPAELLDYFRIASQLFALQEAGVDADKPLVDELSELRERIRRYYRRSG